MESEKRKNRRTKITSLNDFNNVVELEQQNFEISNEVLQRVYKSLEEEKITYKVDSIEDFINYINNINIFESEHNQLWEKIKKIKKLQIDRVEYERIPTSIDDVEHILKEISKIKEYICEEIDSEGELKLQALEYEIQNDYVYAKDIELLKRMITYNNKSKEEIYNEETQIKTLIIKMPSEISYDYVKADKGSVEYHQHIKSYIPRIRRLINNIDKYLIKLDNEKKYKINQSIAMQDSVNMAIAVFNNKEFRAVSGKNDIENGCKLIPQGQEFFISCKVNKLGKLGTGYNRINDSEKKILEEIHKQIKNNSINDIGDLVLYTKWEPCPSCYYVISQFSKEYPNINIKVKYHRNYGEQ